MPVPNITNNTDAIIDVSHYQPSNDCDYKSAKDNGIVSVIIKASQGEDYKDVEARNHTIKAHKEGLLLGFYHFLTAEEPYTQATNFMDAVDTILKDIIEADPQKGFYYPNIKLFLDWENNPHSQATEEIVEEFLDQIEFNDNTMVIYGNPGTIGMHPGHLASDCDLWLPKYGDPPVAVPGWDNSKLKLWQYTDGKHRYSPKLPLADYAAIPGMPHLDRSIFFGTQEELIKWWTT